jgi:hypothetical protein
VEDRDHIGGDAQTAPGADDEPLDGEQREGAGGADQRDRTPRAYRTGAPEREGEREERHTEERHRDPERVGPGRRTHLRAPSCRAEGGRRAQGIDQERGAQRKAGEGEGEGGKRTDARWSGVHRF